MKKLINDPRHVVRESLEGTVLGQPGTALLGDDLTVVRTDRVVGHENRTSVPVAVLAGGGAGHEPAHAGYVAAGMLTAAVSGDVFSSPSVDAVLAGVRAVTGAAGCLLVVKSYTGDRLNFGLAAELARAEGLAVEMVVVGDDVAIEDSDANAGRRGLAGTVLVEKVAGAAAEAGSPLDEVTSLARTAASVVGTMGVGLTAVTLPAVGEPSFALGPDEIELGLGIHGEPGVTRERLRPVDDLVADLVGRICVDRAIERGSRVAVLVGSTGATPPMELSIASRGVVAALEARGVEVVRLWTGLVMTSLDMAGLSVTLLPLDADARLLTLLGAPTAARAWPGRPTDQAPVLTVLPVPAEVPAGFADEPDDVGVRTAIDAACAALVDAVDELTRLDQEVGDGDLGAALLRGAQAWTAAPGTGSAAAQLRRLSEYARRDVGGTSGPLYAAGLLQVSRSLADGATWPVAFAAGAEAVAALGGARAGDRTMLDALLPAAAAAPQGVRAAASAAHDGADATANQLARRGRSSYLGDRVRGHPDPGAVAVTVWLDALADLAAEG